MCIFLPLYIYSTLYSMELDFEERCRRQAEALERAKLLNEQAEQLKKEADRLGNQ